MLTMLRKVRDKIALRFKAMHKLLGQHEIAEGALLLLLSTCSEVELGVVVRLHTPIV